MTFVSIWCITGWGMPSSRWCHRPDILGQTDSCGRKSCPFHYVCHTSMPTLLPAQPHNVCIIVSNFLFFPFFSNHTHSFSYLLASIMNPYICANTLHTNIHTCRHETSDYEGRKTIERDQFRLRHYAGDVTYYIEGKTFVCVCLSLRVSKWIYKFSTKIIFFSYCNGPGIAKYFYTTFSLSHLVLGIILSMVRAQDKYTCANTWACEG